MRTKFEEAKREAYQWRDGRWWDQDHDLIVYTRYSTGSGLNTLLIHETRFVTSWFLK